MADRTVYTTFPQPARLTTKLQELSFERGTLVTTGNFNKPIQILVFERHFLSHQNVVLGR